LKTTTSKPIRGRNRVDGKLAKLGIAMKLHSYLQQKKKKREEE
jgi:hypothetical protein